MRIPAPHFQISLDSESADIEARTVPINWYTGSEIPIHSWEHGRSQLRFSMDPKHVRMERLQSGRAPIVKNHEDYTVDSVIGVLENAQLEDGSGVAVGRFLQDDPDADRIWNKISQRVIANVSMSARVHKMQDVTPPAKGKGETVTKQFLAVDWEPLNVGVVASGADPNAQISLELSEFQEVELQLQGTAQEGKTEVEENKQTTTENTGDGAPALAAEYKENGSGQTQVNLSVISQQSEQRGHEAGQKAERARVAAINAIGAPFVANNSIKKEFLDVMLSDGTEVDAAREKILNELVKASSENETQSGAKTDIGRVEVTRDESDTRREGIELAILNRVDPTAFKMEDKAREYAGDSLFELAALCVQAAGGKTRGIGSKMDILAAAFNSSNNNVVRLGMHTTSDFPHILENVMNKTLRRAYEAAPQTWRPLAVQNDAVDFKEISRTQLGSMEDLEQVNQSGEFTRATVGEAKEVYRLLTVGKIIALTRQAIINDDLGAFQRLGRDAGRVSARYENKTVWGLITANAAMGDGVALFHASHGNLAGVGGAISDTTLGAGRAAMRLQVGVAPSATKASQERLNLTPNWLIGPAALETEIDKWLAGTTPNEPAQVNPFGPQGTSTLNKIVEPILDADSATAWYLASSIAQIDIIEYSYLRGQAGPYTETATGFEIDGQQFKTRLDFGAKVLDWRGLYKNGGA